MAPESIPCTAFTTPDVAAYEFRVMLFGLKNAPATFQKMMTEVLAGYVYQFVIPYLDDVIIFSASPEKHLYHLRLVFERLQQFRLRCGLEKCQFAKPNIDFLGHELTSSGTKPLHRHVLRLQSTYTASSEDTPLETCGTARTRS